MNKLENIEFFVYKGQFDHLTDEQEHALKVQWLRQRRRETLNDPEYRKDCQAIADFLAASEAQPETEAVSGPQLGEAPSFEAA